MAIGEPQEITGNEADEVVFEEPVHPESDRIKELLAKGGDSVYDILGPEILE
ncbi:hypothetical protein HN512_05280 [Candidatus Peregrinibacteria bacterium]|jgi:hypothetical protein|nr:hypothetical protein [Candidatus Peregrinibacteria bacterium]MBT3599218.1 hypothetical protein [Candidatus Peregrinibacteria bacterium]MBT4367471.1 hypothetical protein [Candidatus Peregrinibacteria bacterium]MBT4585591.1 hypothetical protein [Candidatus Peregrinibacteria bacterium]MBT6731019.1 hypothetical protein [Candidatus Peregrinibacteria bacterium]